jgi:hypothetical protein
LCRAAPILSSTGRSLDELYRLHWLLHALSESFRIGPVAIAVSDNTSYRMLSQLAHLASDCAPIHLRKLSLEDSSWSAIAP